MDIFLVVICGITTIIATIHAISQFNNTGSIDIIRTINAVFWGIIFVIRTKRCLNKTRQDSDARSERKNNSSQSRGRFSD